MKMNFRISTFAAAMALSTTWVAAATLDVVNQANVGTVQFMLDGNPMSAAVYRTTAKVDGGASFEVLCFELLAGAQFPYTGDWTSLTSANPLDLSSLFDGYRQSSMGVTETLALQLGIWDLQLGDRLALVPGSEVANTIGAFLTVGDPYAWKASVFSDGLGKAQDFGTFTPAVPEPATYALMIAGLGAVGFVARRQRRSAIPA